MGYPNLQRELYNLLQGSQIGTCSRKISNADWLVDRSFSNEPNEISLNNIFSSFIHNEQARKRDTKATEKQHNPSMNISLNNERLEINNHTAFNFGSGSFKPKDQSEGTILSIKQLRKRSLDLPASREMIIAEKEIMN